MGKAKGQRERVELTSKTEQKRLASMDPGDAPKRLASELKRAKQAVLDTKVALGNYKAKFKGDTNFNTPAVLTNAMDKALAAQKVAKAAIKKLQSKGNGPLAMAMKNKEVRAKMKLRDQKNQIKAWRKKSKSEKIRLEKVVEKVKKRKKKIKKMEAKNMKAVAKYKKKADRAMGKAEKKKRKASKKLNKLKKKLAKLAVPQPMMDEAVTRLKQVRAKKAAAKQKVSTFREVQGVAKGKVAKKKILYAKK